jgi:zinc protease
MEVAIAGDFETGQVVGELDRLFGGWTGTPRGGVEASRTQLKEPVRAMVRMEDKSSAAVALGQAGALLRKDPDYFAARIGNAILGQSTLSSRLGMRVRDREGLSYGVYSVFSGASLVEGLWYVTMPVAPENVDRAIASALDELERALREGVTEKEVEDYKANFTGSFKVSLATNAGIASRLLEAEFYGFDPGYLDD